ncbi:hypothetical protein FNB15_01915 [Ferrovibrio terrae]|uniref:Restriction endonuclease type IV Mrr domain-containing protein n=1 Tax=Ferrovibrio terrae TaxID=2594003 RepID=A0A516GXP9_9PROT|nr:hypothetical protein [Ferrovibrio terrae]QDO96110.1 hypothetical protein FNB15_01915 [Ferrovibrio terrae]
MKEKSVWKSFESIIENILRAEQLYVQKEPNGINQPSADFLVSANQITAAVEVKLYSSRETSLNSLLQSAFVLDAAQSALNAPKSILIVGNELSKSAIKSINLRFPKMIVYDLSKLLLLLAKHPQYTETFHEIIRQARPFSSDADFLIDSKNETISIIADLSAPDHTASVFDKPTETRSRVHGKTLWEQLNSENTRGSYKLFETKMTEVLRYIFEGDLTNWAREKSTHSRASRYDLIARVSSNHDVWKLIADQFRSRYIIFEFKDYSKKIKQGQIYTTEKYLYLTALRSTAIIISRYGADNNAISAARGALREHGKLIILLALDDIKKMLDQRDLGNDHNSVLSDLMDDMLMRLER